MTGGNSIERRGLSTAWERRVVRGAVVLAVATAILAVSLGAVLAGEGIPWWLSLTAATLLSYLVYVTATRKLRKRRRILAQPFPAEWEAILQREVAFFRALDAEEQRRFRRELQVFLGEKLITGIKLKLDTTTRVLAAASAVIPIFGFPDWEWDQISEVLIYPDRFGRDFQFESGDRRHTLGMVGTGALNRLMILSKPDVLAGFRNPGDKRNVGLHEFAHLVDKSDGAIDGLPGVGLDRASIGPWVELVRRKMEEMRRGDSDIDPYGLTNEAEFFAVATEYFFERPGVMQRKAPGVVLDALARVQPAAGRARGEARTRDQAGPSEIRSELALSVRQRGEVQEVLPAGGAPGVLARTSPRSI